MVQYRDLNAPPARTLAEIVADMNSRDRQSKTGDAGVKDLGESGDVVWPRTDGEVASIRDVDLELADARQRIEDAEGDLAGAQARIDTALDAEGHIREDEILRNATLLGETVVEQINVTDKLVGVDGVFTGTVDFANVNVTGELLANEISGERIYGTVLEGGEIRTGSDESRGSFILGDRAYVSPLDGYTSPGIQFVFPGAARPYPAGIGIDANAVAISGGRRADDAYARLNVGAGSVSMASSPPANDPLGWGSRLNVSKDVLQLLSGLPDQSEAVEVMASGPLYAGGTAVSKAFVRLSVKHGGKRARIEATDGVSTVESSDGTTSRSLRVDSGGVWAAEGSTSVSLIPQVRQFQYSAQWNADQSPAHIMVQHLPGGKLCQAQIRIQNLTGSSFSLPYNDWVTLNYNPIPSDLRGGFTDYIEVRLPQADGRGVVEMNYSTGSIRIRNLHRNDQGGINLAWTNNTSIWFPMRWFSPN